MGFEPRNRYVLVELQDESVENDSSVLVPEGYEPKKQGYAIVEVLKTSYDTSYTPIVKEKDKAVVVRNMVEDIKVGESTYSVILENHILGILK